MARRNSILALTTASLLGAFIALGMQQFSSPLVENVSVAQDTAPRAALTHAVALSDGFKWVAQTVSPSVVSINTVRRGYVRPSAGLPREFEEMFGDELGLRPRSFEQRGSGSGVIVSQDGMVLTNNHVVGDATEVQVRLYDGRELEAKVVGADPKTDVAVIKIDAKGLRPAALGDSDQVDVGEWVLAIGSPFRLNHSVTAGIISARGRGGMNVTDYEDFFQTDAAINPGNSGGPLVNLRGEVIGINTAIKSETGSFAGIGFAIPSNLAHMVMDQLVDNGKVRRGRLGAQIQNLTGELAQSYRYGSTDGALIADVIEGGPAAKAGLKPHDIVSKLNGRRVRSSAQLRNRIAATPPGTKVSLELFRDGKRMSASVTLDALENVDERGFRETPVEQLGLKVVPLTPGLAQRLRISRPYGVIVSSFIENSPIRSLGLRPGDMIVSVDDKDIRTPQELVDAMKSADLKRGIRLQVQRDGVSRILLLRIG